MIKLKLIFFRDSIDISYMFYNCYSLISLSDYNEINLDISYIQIYIINMIYNLFGYNSLISILDISELNTYNVKDMSYIFDCCES